jgi:type II secretion system protein E
MAANSMDAILSQGLIEKGYLTKDTLDPVVMKSAQAAGGLGPLLVSRGMVSEDVVLTILSEKLNIPKMSLTGMEIDKAAISKVPLKFAEYYKFVPIKLENKKLTVAVSAPLETRTQDEIRAQLGCEIQQVLARLQDIADAVKKCYGVGAGTIDKILKTTSEKDKDAQKIEAAQPEEKVEEIEKLAEDASVIKLVNQILLDAYQKRATDIHVEPYRGKVKVRYRIDGVLYNTNMPPEIKQFIMPIVSRIKIMSNLNIIEKRLPQDGRAIVKISGETLDLRISSIPTPTGESIVIRLLPVNRLFSLEKLGLDAHELKIFSRLIEKPHGIILITGPTGSGKSTTLYASLSMINTDERKIITIEDPVEYEMEGVTQIQVVPAVGLDFAKGLRSILRHDPDVIMVGEIRDLETAETAARVALTGHLVFSTLHTNDAASGITRLVDIGVEPYLVASSVEAFIAQRLVRMICQHCKEEDTQSQEFKQQMAREMSLPLSEVKIYRGKGCDKCNKSGFWGRVAIFEVLLLDEEIRQLVMKRVPAGQVKKIAIAKGMRTLRQSGWRKVIAGVATPEEIIEVAEEEERSKDEPAVGQAAEPIHAAPAGGLHEAVGGQPADALAAGASAPKPQMELSVTEKRIYKRLDIKVNVRHQVIQSGEQLAKKGVPLESFTVTKNLSAGGLVFASESSVPLGSIVELKIELPDTAAPVECLTRVMRVEETEPGKAYDVAVCFLDLSGADRKKLDQFVSEEITLSS